MATRRQSRSDKTPRGRAWYVHPFPARKPPGIVDGYFRGLPAKATILDPMCGSGTALREAILRGHRAKGIDRDPLAVLMTRVGLRQLDADRLESAAMALVERARVRKARWTRTSTWRRGMDDETVEYIEYWFDKENREQLRALADEIRKVRRTELRNALWIAFSRMIIVKADGVSRGMDIAHSRPHRVYKRAPKRAFDAFLPATRAVARATSVLPASRKGAIEIRRSDARKMPFGRESIDAVITSPPYLTAIDYIRGHRLALVWMGYRVDELKELRANNMGTENSQAIKKPRRSEFVTQVATSAITGKVPSTRLTATVERYVADMDRVIAEISRVLKPNGRAVFVVGDCTVGGSSVSNATIVRRCAKQHGLVLVGSKQRDLAAAHRYLPPPTHAKASSLKLRMRHEHVLSFRKSSSTRFSGAAAVAERRLSAEEPSTVAKVSPVAQTSS